MLRNIFRFTNLIIIIKIYIECGRYKTSNDKAFFRHFATGEWQSVKNEGLPTVMTVMGYPKAKPGNESTD